MENIHTEDKYLVSSSKLSDLLLISKYLLNMGYVYLGYSDHCTIGSLGRRISRYIGRLLTNYWLTVDRLSVDSWPIDWPTVDQYIRWQSTDKCAHIGWCIGRQSVNCRPIYRPTDKCVHIGWCIALSVNYRSTFGRLSIDYQLTVNW